jgi:uncharacterized protein with FMN-binding domain
VIELKTGAKLRCKIVSVSSQVVVIRARIGTRTFTRKYPLSKVSAIVRDGKRRTFGKSKPSRNKSKKPGTKTDDGETRSKSQILALIKKEGSTAPEWYESTPLDYPKTLDLSWPQPPPKKGWNDRVNVGQYIWSVVNPNPRRWKGGVKLLHHLLLVNKDKPAVQLRIMNSLGVMYHHLHEDHARAAFWWQKARVDKSKQFPRSSVHLAECYWNLGSKAMALELINSRDPQFQTIKLLADLGETDQALRLSARGVRDSPSMAYLYAGDACRVAERFDDAVDYYRKALDVEATGKRKKRIENDHKRARASMAAIRLFETLDVGKVPDGIFQADSIGYVGPVRIAVTVKGGRITDVRVVQHREKQFYSAITDTTRKIMAKQGVRGVDATSSATITSEAIINATAKALAAEIPSR